jgi:hypothetical protein
MPSPVSRAASAPRATDGMPIGTLDPCWKRWRGEGGSVSFATDIKPLFRESDREAMDFVFDLWSYDDVKNNAELILKRIEDGSMPCDQEWSADQIARFRTWIAEGCPA